MDITVHDARKYVADAAESAIEDDLNEDGLWTDEQFEQLREVAFSIIRDLRQS